MTTEPSSVPNDETSSRAASAPRKPPGQQTWQIVLTWAFLGLSVPGFVGSLIAPPLRLMVALELTAVTIQYGPSAPVATLYTAVAWLLVILFVATWTVSIILLVKKKVSFYVPIAAGAIAALVYAATFALRLIL